jgi:hypothetical protein
MVELGEGREDLRSHPPQFVAMGDGERAEDGLAPGRDVDQAVEAVGEAPQEPGGDHAPDLTCHLSAGKLHLPGEGAEGRQAVRGEPFDREEDLVLLGRKPRLPGRGLAEREEPPDEVAEEGERGIIRAWRNAAVGHRRGLQIVCIQSI